MSTTTAPKLVTAQLCCDGIDVLGALTFVDEVLRFAPKRGLTSDERATVLNSELTISWGETGVRCEQPATADADEAPDGANAGRLLLQPTGPVKRKQLRAAERRTAALPVVALLAEADGLVLRRAQTIDISRGGLSFLLERDPDLDGPPPPPQPRPFGVVIDLPELRVGAVADAVGTIANPVRTGGRARFDRINSSYVEAIERFVALTVEGGHERYAMSPRQAMGRAAIRVDHVSGESATPDGPTRAVLIPVGELAPIPVEIIDQRAREATVRLLRTRDVAGRAIVSTIDFSRARPAFVYANDGTWLLGEIDRFTGDEVILRFAG